MEIRKRCRLTDALQLLVTEFCGGHHCSCIVVPDQCTEEILPTPEQLHAEEILAIPEQPAEGVSNDELSVDDNSEEYNEVDEVNNYNSIATEEHDEDKGSILPDNTSTNGNAIIHISLLNEFLTEIFICRHCVQDCLDGYAGIHNISDKKIDTKVSSFACTLNLYGSSGKHTYIMEPD